MINGLNGSLAFDGNTPYISGSFSGFNTAALVDAAVQARRIPADRLEAKISGNETRIAALQELSGLLSDFQASVDGLRNPPGFGAFNVFDQNQVTITSTGSTPGTDIVVAAADSNAPTGSFDLEILQLATAHKVSGGTIADATAALGITDTVSVAVDGRAPVSIGITATMSLNDIAAAIEAQSGASGVRASVVQLSPTDSRLVLTAQDSNRALQLSGGDPATLAALGVSSDNGATFSSELQAFQPAQLRIDGIPTIVERDENLGINDLVPGITLDLSQTTQPGESVRLEVQGDAGQVRDQILQFVDAYNALKQFTLAQQSTGEGGASEDAVLFSNNTLRLLDRDVANDIATLVGNLPADAFSTLADIGIGFPDPNSVGGDAASLLTIKDQNKFDSAIIEDLEQVRSVFEFGFAANSAEIRITARSQPVDVGSFTLDINAVDGNGDITNATVGGVEVFDYSGKTLVGRVGTPYEGLSLTYIGGAATSIDIDTSLGIGERLYQRIESYIGSGGILTDEISSLQQQNTDYSEEIAAIDGRLDTYRQTLIEKYQRMEQAIAQAEAMRQQMDAFLKSLYSDN